MPKRCAIVTGGAGFIGSHVVDALLAEHWRVVVVDDLSTGNADRVARKATLEVVDISDRCAFDPVLDAVGPEAIFHLAAQSSVTRSLADPERDCEINVLGTLNVLEGATRHGAPVVFTSTGGALYGDSAPLPTSEDTPPAPISPYGASKWAGEADRGQVDHRWGTRATADGRPPRSCLDRTRARKQLGWHAEIGLEEGLAGTFHALVEEFELDGSPTAN